MNDQSPSLFEIGQQLGQISGQLRELIHGVNGVSAKQDALAIRVARLEESEAGRKAQANLLTSILKSPTIGWLVGAAMTAWAILTGRVHV